MDVKLKAPKGTTGASWNGVEYPVKRGNVTVPEEAVADLVEHGFTNGEEDQEAE